MIEARKTALRQALSSMVAVVTRIIQGPCGTCPSLTSCRASTPTEWINEFSLAATVQNYDRLYKRLKAG